MVSGAPVFATVASSERIASGGLPVSAFRTCERRPIGGDERAVSKWLLGFAATCSLKAMLIEVDCTHVKTVDELSPAVTKGAKYIRIELATLDAAHLNLMQVDTDARCKTMHIAELGFT